MDLESNQLGEHTPLEILPRNETDRRASAGQLGSSLHLLQDIACTKNLFCSLLAFGVLGVLSIMERHKSNTSKAITKQPVVTSSNHNNNFTST